MSSRYETRFELEPNLYVKGSPVMVETGKLLYDTQTGSSLVLLKYRSLSEKAIQKMRVDIHIKGKQWASPVNETSHFYDFGSLNEGKGIEPYGSGFGSKEPILVQTEEGIGSVTVTVRGVRFVDGSEWVNTEKSVSRAVSDLDNWNAISEETTPIKNQETKSDSKKIIGAVIAVALVFLFVMMAKNGNSSPKTSNVPSSSTASNTTSSSSSSSYESSTPSFSDSELESLAVLALADKLYDSTNQYGTALEKLYDIPSTRYSIGTIKEKDKGGWEVKGKFSLYDDYGSYKKSGTFRVEISTYGSTSCWIDLD